MALRLRVLARREVVFKALLFLLLAVDTAYFALYGTPSKGLDAGAWLTLFALFEAETSFPVHVSSARRRLVLRALRLVAAMGVIAASVGYVFEDNALDAVNSALWIAVIVLLEAELRFPRVAERHRTAFGITAAALYGGLGLLVLVWAVRGMWIDAYDAALWLTAFVTIELDIVRRLKRNAAAAPA
jgi:hypothetical protein